MSDDRWWTDEDATLAQCAIEDERHNYRIAAGMGHIDKRTMAERYAIAALASLAPIVERIQRDASDDDSWAVELLDSERKRHTETAQERDAWKHRAEAAEANLAEVRKFAEDVRSHPPVTPTTTGEEMLSIRLQRWFADDLEALLDDAALQALAEARVSTDDGVRHDLDDVTREFGVTE